jgi:serine/threonine protein kinase/tetratricopeptide (TPR) repeat protein
LNRAEAVQAILANAADAAPDQLNTLLDRECAKDPQLREEVESLLRHLSQAGRFLAAPTVKGGAQMLAAADDMTKSPAREGPGTRIGPYKLLQLIGEGGFGSVFLAEQEQPVRRKVALKIIKLGMDTRQVVARFEQERQALAMMDHSNIARVFDAGETEAGRPFFAMELVNGDPITAYCDRNCLSIVERLELFAQVCSALQHAHTKGIIHRDLKPSNILVSTQEGRPNAKVIDFGIAKATSAPLTDKTLFTEHRQMMGTPEYMSPEQVEGSLDIDTRTDVYSLGVLLYELLTGTTPFSGKELRSAAYGEIQRIIREVDPASPSTRLSQDSGTLANIAAQRRTQPAKLGAIIRGELDWVVMKALDKERKRRYESPSSLEADVRRYLNGEAVIAAPQSKVYRIRKFVFRHKGTVSAVSAVLIVLMIGIVAFAWQARIAIRQRDAAELARAEVKIHAEQLKLVSDFQSRMLGQIDPTLAGEQLRKDLSERFANALERSEVSADDRVGRTQFFTRELSEINATDVAAAMIDRMILEPSIREIDLKFKAQPDVDAQLRYAVAEIYDTLGMSEKALSNAAASAETFERVHGKDHEGAILSRKLQGVQLRSTGRYEEATVIARGAVDSSLHVYGPNHKETFYAKMILGINLAAQHKYAEAEPLLQGALEGYRRLLGNDHRDTLACLTHCAFLYSTQGELVEAEKYLREAYDTSKRVLGSEDPDMLDTTANMGTLLAEMGKLDEAATLLGQAAEGFRKVCGEDHPQTLASLRELGKTFVDQHKLDDAEKVFIQILGVQRRTLGKDHPDIADGLVNLAMVRESMGRLDESRQGLEEAVAMLRYLYPQGSIPLALNMWHLGRIQLKLNGPMSALPLLEESEAMAEQYLPATNPQLIKMRDMLFRERAKLHQ